MPCPGRRTPACGRPERWWCCQARHDTTGRLVVPFVFSTVVCTSIAMAVVRYGSRGRGLRCTSRTETVADAKHALTIIGIGGDPQFRSRCVAHHGLDGEAVGDLWKSGCPGCFLTAFLSRGGLARSQRPQPAVPLSPSPRSVTEAPSRARVAAPVFAPCGLLPGRALDQASSPPSRSPAPRSTAR